MTFSSVTVLDLDLLGLYVTFCVMAVFKEKWQQKFLSSHLKETPKLYIEAYYRILALALFRDVF